MSERPVAIFDLDGTLTTRNTFIPYLLSFGKRHRKYAAMSKLPIQIGPYLLRIVKDWQLKERLLQSFFAGVPRDAIERHTDWFCEKWLPKRTHPLGSDFLRHHLQRGDRVVLLSASPDLYVPAIAERLGIAETVCTRVAFDRDICTGRLLGTNCKGDHKLSAIQQHLGCVRPQSVSFAYGDSRHDLPVLRWANHGVLIRSRRTLPVAEDCPATLEALASRPMSVRQS